MSLNVHVTLAVKLYNFVNLVDKNKKKKKKDKVMLFELQMVPMMRWKKY